MKSVLLVEDLAFSRATEARTIQAVHPCTIVEAENATQALRILEDRKDIDLVIADLSMPESNGLELLKAVRMGETPAPRELPFIIVSGALTKSVQEALDALDISAAIDKPITKKSLANAIDAIENEKPPLRSADDYQNVAIAGLLQADALDESHPIDPREDFDRFIAFLHASPVLNHLDRSELERIAKRVRLTRYPADTIIDGGEFGNTRLPLITWGEAEILQSAQLPDGEAVEHRVVLLEAGNLLGIFNFMDPPSGYQHPKVRTTRPTDVAVLDFGDGDDGAEMGAIRDKVRLTIGRILSERITYSDKALAMSLTNQLAETRRKRTAGGYVIMMLVLLSIYTLIVRALLEADLTGTARTICSVGLILMALAPFGIILKAGDIKAAELGLTLRGTRAAILDAVLMSSIFLGVLIGLKFLVVTLVPAFQAQAMFGTSDEFTRLLPHGGIDWVFYAVNVFIYALFVPAQEIIARCGIQSLLVEFLYGSETQRNVVAIVVSNFIFAATHAHLNLGFALATFLGGLFFGWLFYRNRSIIGVSIAHFIVGGSAIFALRLEAFLG